MLVGKLPVLDVKKKYPNVTLDMQVEKLHEEVKEVKAAKTLREKALETLDVIQAAMGVLEMLESIVDLKAMNVEHLKKLADRHWTFKDMLEIHKGEY